MLARMRPTQRPGSEKATYSPEFSRTIAGLLSQRRRSRSPHHGFTVSGSGLTTSTTAVVWVLEELL